MKLLPLLLVFILSFLSATTALANNNNNNNMDDSKKDCKTEFPELQGKTADEAKQEIAKEDSSLNVQVVPKDSMVTMDYRTDRVRVFVDDKGIVTGTPRVG